MGHFIREHHAAIGAAIFIFAIAVVAVNVLTHPVDHRGGN